MNPDPLTFAQTVVVNITAELNGLKAGNARLIVERDEARRACENEKDEVRARMRDCGYLRAQLIKAQEQLDARNIENTRAAGTIARLERDFATTNNAFNLAEKYLTASQQQVTVLQNALRRYLTEPSIDGRAIRQQMRDELADLVATIPVTP